MNVVAVFFWVVLFLLFWTFLGYPCFIVLLANLRPKQWHKDPYCGFVSMIIAAYNEEDVIRKKVANCCLLDFTPATAEIIIVSDGSQDKTNCVLEQLVDKKASHIKFVKYHPRAGKAHALNVGVGESSGDVLIFSDANVIIGEKSCQALLAPFADSCVGVVCGRVLVKARGEQEVAGESLYMRYESAVQQAEGSVYSMVGVDGALFAIRRDLYKKLEVNTILDDFTLSMNAPIEGKRIVYEGQAIAVEEVVPSAKNEMKRKSRIVSGGFQYLANILRQSNKLSYWMWFCFLSHKIIRWVAPFLLLLVFVFNVMLLSSFFFYLFLFCQLLFYFLALLGQIFKSLRKNYVVYLPYYFCIVNVAAFQGFIRFLFSGKTILWEKVER